VKKLVFAVTVAVTSLTGVAGVVSAQEYPPDTTAAQAPPPTTQVAAQPPTVGLPATGSDVSDVLRIGALLATGGLIFVGLARRRSQNANAPS
jgi:LPXTG-motif cell wall-anchored protein